MKFYKIQMLGRFISEYVADVSALSYNAALDKGRIIYDETTDALYFGDDSGSGQFSPIATPAASASIPSSEIILFEKNTVVSGYTLLTSIDDETVFISKGSGSVIGPGASSVGTWTQPGHAHTGPSHTHTGPSHDHSTPAHSHSFAGGASTGNEIAGGTGGLYANGSSLDHHTHDLGGISTTSGGAGTTGAGGTGSTGSEGTGATSSSATANTWRPAGRIFTRQQKI